MGKLIGGIVVVLVVLGGIYWWMGSSTPAAAPVMQNKTVNEPVVTPTPTTITPPAAAPTTGTVREITVSGNEFAFTPSTLTLKKGETVKVTFKNTGQYPHNFTITDLNVASQNVAAGGMTTVQFTPDKTGTFTYNCTVDSHTEKGMKGTVTVQ